MTPCKSQCSLETFWIFLHFIFNRKHGATSRILEDHSTFHSVFQVLYRCVKPMTKTESIVHVWEVAKRKLQLRKIWTSCSLQTRTVLISKNKVHQILSINTAHMFILIKVSFVLYYSFRYTVDIPYVHQKRF